MEDRTQFSTPGRLDPYKNFNFRLKWGSQYVAGISKISVLKRTTEVVKHRDGGDTSSMIKSPGRTEYDAITLERGVTQDVAFQQWADCFSDPKYIASQQGAAPAKLPPDFRKELILESYDEAGKKVLALHLHSCWVSQYQALPNLDGPDNAIAIEEMTLETEGWEQESFAAG